MIRQVIPRRFNRKNIQCSFTILQHPLSNASSRSIVLFVKHCVEWPYPLPLAVLHLFGFGPHIIKLIQILYTREVTRTHWTHSELFMGWLDKQKKNTTESFVAACTICAQTKNSSPAPVGPLILLSAPKEPFENVPVFYHRTSTLSQDCDQQVL